MTPLPPPPSPGMPSAPPPMPPPAPGGGDAADRAADAMIENQDQSVQAIAALNPQPADGNGFSVAKIQHIVDLVNDVIAKFAPQAKNKLVWAPPKTGKKPARFYTAQFPGQVFVPVMQLLLLVAKMLPPDLAAKVEIDPQVFATDSGLDTVIARLATLLQNKVIHAALLSHQAPTKKDMKPEPKPPMAEAPKPAEHADAAQEASEDMALAGAPSRSA